MAKKLRFRATLTYEYAVNPENYPEGSGIEDMLEIDRNDDMIDIIRDEGTLKIEVIKD